MIRFACLRTLHLAGLVLPALLAGCAALPPAGAPATQPAAQPAEARPYHRSIDIGGRLTVRYQQNGADQAMHGSFTWAQRPERTDIALLSPLGQTIATITLTPGNSSLTLAGQAQRSAADADALAAQTLGWPLPVSGLRDWLQGFAEDSRGQRFTARPPAPAELATRDGWRLSYAAWKDDADTSAQNYPRRIDLARSTEQAGDVAIRIVIDKWEPQPESGRERQ